MLTLLHACAPRALLIAARPQPTPSGPDVCAEAVNSGYAVVSGNEKEKNQQSSFTRDTCIPFEGRVGQGLGSGQH